MSEITLTAITPFIAGKPQLVTFPGSGRRWKQVRLTNLTQQTLSVYTGTQGPENLPPGWTNVYDIQLSNQVQVTAPNTDGGSCLVDLSDDKFVGIYPNATAPSVAQQWVSVGSHTAIAGVDSFDTSQTPSGTVALAIGLGSGVVTGLQIIGNQSGTFYLVGGAQAPLSAANYLVIPVNGLIDNTFHISWTALGPGIKVVAFATSSPTSIPGLGQQPSNISVPVVIASDQPSIPTSTGIVDGGGFSAPGAGIAPAVILPATAGKKWVLASFEAVLLSNGNADVGEALQLLDGAAIIRAWRMGVPAPAGSTHTITQTKIGIPGTAGNTMTLQLAGIGATAFASIDCSAFLK